MGVAAATILALQAAFLSDLPTVPDRSALWAVRRSPGMTFLDKHGNAIATRGARYGSRVTLATLPPYVPRAFLAAEDRRFYVHGPVDLWAIARAARRDLMAGKTLEGGSTLSQQLARTLFLTTDHTFRRKLQEAVLAARLEAMLGKDQVLELYLNRTYFGDGAYGLDAAARTYFSEGAAQLTLSQAATLAALPNAPTRLALTNDMAAAWTRARKILGVMGQEKWISPTQESQALADPPVLVPEKTGEGDWGYILDEAGAEAGALSGGAADLVVRLTVDPDLQRAAVASVRHFVETEGRRRGADQGALVALAPDGAILAMVGGLDHDKSAFNRATQARRQPGSAFKAFVYGAAVERGVLPSDIRSDSPVSLGRWTPTDYGGHYAGPVTVEEALARSINTVSVRLTLEVGPDQVAAFARRCGLTDIPEHPGPSIALGAYEVTLVKLAGAYQVFQNGGGKTTPYLISQIATTAGDIVFSNPPSAPVPIYDPLYASRMVRMLKAVVVSGTGAAANIGRPAAGKTGTSQNWRDAWFVGFTPDLLAGVWVGADDDRPTAGVTGGEIPARIWRAFMIVAEKATPPTDFPWLVTEPQAPPPATEVTGSSVYEDEPPGLEEDGLDHPGRQGEPMIDAPGGDVIPDGPDAYPYYPPPEDPGPQGHRRADPYDQTPPPNDRADRPDVAGPPYEDEPPPADEPPSP
ncbi:MAG: transglycosylase domain-containing protein [Caulobacteraceae bacterium]